jgi:hypothetical protein
MSEAVGGDSKLWANMLTAPAQAGIYLDSYHKEAS